uniref:Major facilitator superfamily (MFS) profile domain-containing protein n=1 Tax=Leersia perrieri TaxID=77586 RepID=A0A0D9W6L0_9ORYZ
MSRLFTCLRMLILSVVTSMANIPAMLNLVTYLNGTMHMGVSSSSTTVTNFIGATSGFALLGAFLSDSYITRSKTILLFGPLEFLGFGLLALQAYLPSLHPLPCNTEAELRNCEEVHGLNNVILHVGLYTWAFSEGCMRACAPSLGADQFDHEDPSESRQQSSFFNWYTFGISLGGFIGLILIVWLENYKGWDIGFGVCALIILLGLVVVASALPLYRNQVPEGSPLTRILQVLVVAFRNRNYELPEKLEEAQENHNGPDSIEVPCHTDCLKYLDKASINHGEDGAWSVCSTKKVEETKIVLRMLPLFISSMVGYISNPLLLTFTVQQGSMTNTSLGKIHISPATLFVIPITFQMLMLAIYDRFLVPFMRKRTGYVCGITHLQRVGLGFASMIFASVIAAIVERKRKEAAVQMSLFWLAPQFFLLGVSDVTSFVGLLEFFNSEAPRGMKSIGTALFWCELGLASWMGTFLVELVNKATRHGHHGGWLEGTTLNNSHLDLFYWVVSVVGLLGFLNYLYWAKKYVYRHDPRILFALRSCPNSANFSLVAYMHGTLHLDIVTSSSMITYLVGVVSFFAALMNILSYAYIKPNTAIFVFGPFAILGYMLLALQSHLPSLHPPICEINKDPSKCVPAHGRNLALLYLSLSLFAIGEGCMRACIPTLGKDQFNNDDPQESRLRSSFLSWLKSANSLGALIGLVFLVWIENNLGWDIGFMLCALIVLVGLVIAASGLPFYGMRRPNGSPVTRILQVLVTSSKKRRAAVVDVIELQEISTTNHVDGEGEDKSDSKSTCTTQLDEKGESITRMLPIFISCLLIYLPFTTMDTRIGMIQIPSASLVAIPTAFHMLMQPCYRRILTPLLRRYTGHTNGITPLQHIGAGSACGTVAACIATLVEAKRLMVVKQQGLTLVAAGVPMSIFWLVMQFFLLSIMDVASFGGLVEFIKSEAPDPKRKHIAPAAQFILVGVAAWSGWAFIQLINRVTRHGDNGRGWLDGTDFNSTRLDRFFFLLATFELMAFINYVFWARRYTGKKRVITAVIKRERLELISRTMAIGGFVDWRGNPINRKVHGGVRAAWFVYLMNIVNVPNMLNMVTYLHGTMHMGVSSSSTTVTNVLGATSGFALLGAFLSDSYITRARTLLLFGPLELLGYGLLALQAYLPSLRPPPCNIDAEVSSCEEVHGRNAVLLYAALYISAFGDGFMRACMPPLGADQFDHEDPSESRQQSSFFNWYTFGISLGGFIGLILIVWLENNKGWDIGFGVCALLILLGLLVVAAGLPLYRNQVLVVAFKNRKLQFPEKLEEAQQASITEQGSTEVTEVPSKTNSSLKFLDKACINGGKDGPWSVCSANNVEETKAVLRLLPVFISSLIGYMSNPLLFTFTVQQGGMTNTRLGRISVSPATLFIIPSAFQLAMLPAYDRLLVPLLRRRTGHAAGVTHLQRVGAGFAAVIVASAIAAVVERKRKAEEGMTRKMSLFWLAPQFFLLGVSDVTSFPGLLELFSSEAPRGMKSIASALFWCELGLSSWLATLLVQVVNRATRRRGGNGGGGWLEGATLDSSRLDLFYWVVAGVGLVGFVNYLFWASRYRYRQDPRVAAVEASSGDRDSP